MATSERDAVIMDPGPSAPGQSAESGLVARAAARDLDAFDALIRPRMERLFRLAVAILHSEPDARDVLQDACLRAWTELPRLRQHDRFDAWLTRIVVNAARSSVRRQRRVRLREIGIDRLGGEAAIEVVHDPRVDDAAELDAIRAAFGRLSGPARSVLALHYVEGRPVAEIAGLTGVPSGTVKWRLWSARRALKAALKAERR